MNRQQQVTFLPVFITPPSTMGVINKLQYDAFRPFRLELSPFVCSNSIHSWACSIITHSGTKSFLKMSAAGNAPCAEAYWWQLSGAIVTGSDVHIRKVSHVVTLMTQRLRGQKDRSADTFGISCDSSRFLFVSTGKSCRDKRNPNCFLDPQRWRRSTWIDQRRSNLTLHNWVNERKCFDFYFGERMQAV